MNTLNQNRALHKITKHSALWSSRTSYGDGLLLEESLDREFPFLVRSLGVTSGKPISPENGEGFFTLILPLDGSLRVQAGRSRTTIAAGEIFVADRLTSPIAVEEGWNHVRVLLIKFLPAFVYSLGSPSHDYFFLLPFCAHSTLTTPVVREPRLLQRLHRIIMRLVHCYVDRTDFFRIGCKAHFLQLLYYLARHFQDADIARSQIILHKDRAARLAPLLRFVERNYAKPITLKEAASMVNMSVSQFVRIFKFVAGMSFVNYLCHLRLSRSVRLLKESSFSISEIACTVGFSDQSYFDRRFKEAFGQTPREFRAISSESSHTNRLEEHGNGVKVVHDLEPEELLAR